MSPFAEVARRAVLDEAEALRLLGQTIGASIEPVVPLLMRPGTQVIVSGLGKSGNIAQKIAASLTSTGTPAAFMHPVEALHGDLGIVTENHCLVALSRSGNTDELVRFVAHFRRLGGPVVAFTQKRESRLAELCNHLVLLPDLPEAGPLNLAPTTSCILQLAAGDALAMALLHARGFRPEHFAQYHPEGTLGRRLLLRAADLMHAREKLPLVSAAAAFDDLLLEMTRKALGLGLVVESDQRFLGTFTDGDLRRLLVQVANPRDLTAREAFQRSRRPNDGPPVPVSTVTPETLAVDCLDHMRAGRITSLVVLDEERRPVGLLRLAELTQAGIV